MEAFLVSAATVALGEIGDKTQLLAIMLAARYRQPLWVCFGILVATAANHVVAAALGRFFASFFSSQGFQLAVGGMFIAMAVWILMPDKPSKGPETKLNNAFWATAVMFFLVEIGDKTQVLTSLLAAKFQSILTVAFATTLGMLIVNVPTVYLGEALLRRIPLKWINITSSIVLVLVGVVTIGTALRSG